jgi:methionyl-tRNA synthetase
VLVATWGNLVNRVLSFAYKHWDGCVPEPGELRPDDKVILESVAAGFKSVGEHIDAVRLRPALNEAVRLASEVNKYLDTSAPWFEIKSDKEDAAKTIFTALQAIDWLKVQLSPFLPFTSERLNLYLGYKQPLFGEQYVETVEDSLGKHTVLRYNSADASGKWEPGRLPAGGSMEKPAPLFRKLEPIVAQEERAKLG